MNKLLRGNNSELRTKAMNICMYISNIHGYFKELPMLSIQLLHIINNEETAFWIANSLLSQPWISSFISGNSFYGLEFHLFEIFYLLKKLFSEIVIVTEDDLYSLISKTVFKVISLNENFIPYIYDIFIMVIY